MKVWDGPSSEGWMPPPRVSLLSWVPCKKCFGRRANVSPLIFAQQDPHSRYSEIVSILKNFRVAR